MKVESIESVDEFIASTLSFRAADPLRTNVIGSVSLAVSTGHTRYDDCHWWTVRDDNDDVVGAAMRTSPFNMIVSPMTSDAARALGKSVGHFDDALPGLTGSVDVIEAWSQGYRESQSPGSLRVLLEQRRDLLYEVEDLATPAAIGRGRPAANDDVELLAHMFNAFVHEVDLEPLSLDDAREGVKKSIAAGSLFCWDIEGAIAALAGHAPVVTTESIVIGRVGPVYTPPEYRNRGFGSAVTAHVTRHLRGQGARVMLFTDAANPTSNSIYQEIGFRLIDEVLEMRFDGTAER
jgi:ribosomal protein S18 acetylase RimI-like enzyme